MALRNVTIGLTLAGTGTAVPLTYKYLIGNSTKVPTTQQEKKEEKTLRQPKDLIEEFKKGKECFSFIKDAKENHLLVCQASTRTGSLLFYFYDTSLAGKSLDNPVKNLSTQQGTEGDITVNLKHTNNDDLSTLLGVKNKDLDNLNGQDLSTICKSLEEDIHSETQHKTVMTCDKNKYEVTKFDFFKDK